jgi:hypothetical protein
MRRFPTEPDLSPRDAAHLSAMSYWTVLREIERGNLRAYRRPGNKLAIRRDDFCTWAYSHPVEPRQPQTASLTSTRLSVGRTDSGSLASLEAIERRLAQ